MVDVTSASRISTHYYKVAHLLLVTYAVYTAKEPTVDQFLLELELQIRNEHPKILITYYNKSLYYFRFDHLRQDSDNLNSEGGQTPSMNGDDHNLQLHLLYPQLSLKHENSVPADQLANPSRVIKNSAGKRDVNSKDELPDGHLAFASLSFLKAVKKTLVYNLSASGEMLLFGNYVVARVSGTSAQYAIVQIDPVLLANGDLIVSLSQRNTLALFDLSILNLDHVFRELASCFVIYVVPSGLRCHLYDTTSMQQSFTYMPPKSSSNLLRLLKLCTGVELKEQLQILWVKLIPNLQHLNNQTSKISRFVHGVDNKKYILWPWELCLLQFGSVEQNPIPKIAANSVDPLSLISDYILYSIQNFSNDFSQRATITSNTLYAPGTNGVATHQPFSVPSGFSTAMSTGDNDIKIEDPNMSIAEVNPEIPNIFDIDHSEDLFGNPSVLDDPSIDNLNLKSMEVKKEDESGDDSDLFGDSPELDTKSIDHPNMEAEALELKPHDVSDIVVDTPESVQKEAVEDFEILQNFEEDQLIFKGEFQQTPEKPGFINIPRDQMISAPINTTPMSYDDPGAPPPIMPTPLIPQSAAGMPGGPNSQSSTRPHTTPKVPSNSFPQSGRPLNPFAPKENKEQLQAEGKLSNVFSPIHFNPMIRSNIDTKYGKGGKFYVAREASAGPEESKFRIRETSVSLYENNRDSSVPREFPGENALFGDPNVSFKEASSHSSQGEIKNEKDKVMETEKDDDEEEDDEDKEEDDEESDVDEELNLNDLKSSPLKLNTHSGDIFQISSSNLNVPENQRGPSGSSNLQTSQANILLSPGPNVIKSSMTSKVDSPFGLGMGSIDATMTAFSPPIVNDLKQDLLQQMINRSDDINMQMNTNGNKELETAESANTPLSTSSSNNGISESSNCLPLILRNINVFSIPNSFMLKKIPGAWGSVQISTGFNMDVDEDEDDFDSSEGPLSVKLKNLDECLKWLTPNLVFDLGLENFEKRLQLKLPDFFSDEVINDVTDGEISTEVKNIFLSAFPLSYRVKLSEFLEDADDLSKVVSDTQIEIDNQLSFLDDITNDDILNSEDSSRKLKSVHWDSIYPEVRENQQNFHTYTELVLSVEDNRLEKKNDEDSVFALNEVKAKVFKNGESIVNLNFVGVKFWDYFNFNPINGPKKFQVLLISENDTRRQSESLFDVNNLNFLDLLKNNYKEGHFGSIKKLNLLTSDTRPDLEGISNGVMLIEKDDGPYRDYYRKINKKLKSLAELIKLDLINKTNRFEFDRPLLLLFVNFDSSINSILQISKICRNFKLFLNDHQLSLVKTFTHIIPWNHIIKQSDSRRRLRYLSTSKLSKLSMHLYNKCPNNDNHDSRVLLTSKDNTIKLYTNLVKEPPTTLHFKFLNKINKEGYSSTFHDDIFLHVAYERSVDKNWISAAWSDPLGVVTHTKSWFCPTTAKANSGDAHELGSLINEIWDISNNLFKKLNEDAVQRACGSGAKNFLVLTRISSIIPDDELVFWKRLTTKHKDISLLVLSANRLPKYLFSSKLPYVVPMDAGGSKTGAKGTFDDQATPNNLLQNAGHGRTSMSSAMSGADFFKSINGLSNAMSPSPSGAGMNVSSPMNNNAFNLHSPQQFLNVPSNFFSPLDAGVGGGNNVVNEADYVLKDPSLEILGVVPKIPLPSFNSPTRLGMRIGYLIREAKVEDTSSEVKYIVFEVTLLSCSSYWNLDAIMKILLNQYKKLIVLNEVMGTCQREPKDSSKESSASELRGLVPWHINAVVKTLDYLVHVNVDEQT